MKSRHAAYRLKRLAASASAIAVSLAIAGVAHAQVSTSTIQGRIDGGSAARVVATNVDNGFSVRDTAGAGGDYVLAGLHPGTYRVQITKADGSTEERAIRVLVGQTASLDFVVEAADEVIVTAARRPAQEVRTSEVATNVSQEQIENLPQSSRNFLNFAALAPGVRVSDDPERKVFSSGALSANQTNVFIDGQSLKNNVLQGGIAGQDASRGNPFPQVAVQEFRVSTQNHKAEYEQAGSAIITAVTRSGSNEIEGEVFGYFQDKSMIGRDPFDKKNGVPKPEYERQQYGGFVSGPIIQDKLHYLFSYEANNQDRASRVDLNDAIPQSIRDKYEGNFVQPFRSELLFGKLSWQPAASHRVDLTVTRREESDVRGFGGDTVLERAENIQIETTSANLRWTWNGDGFLNEASVDFLDAFWAPSAYSDERSEETENGFLRLGGRTYTQDKGQRGVTFRNHLTFTDLEWHGQHVVKVGGKVAFLTYEAVQRDVYNGVFIYNNADLSFSGDPIRARIGFGEPFATSENTQIGLFIQDDWDVTDKLQLNLGLRWDYESNMLNNEFVTPADLAAAVRAYTNNATINWEDYISNGSNRESFTGAFQPRVGFNYDVFGDERTVVFGGWGRYYDRVLFDYAQVETNKTSYQVKQVEFDNDPLTAAPAWNDNYYNRDALLALTSGLGAREVYMLSNDVKMPYSDQLSLGVRHKVGDWITALTYTNIKSYDLFSWVQGARYPNGAFRNANGDLPWGQGPTGFSPIMVSTSDDKAYYEGVYLTLDKPFSRSSGWGFNLAYTYAFGEEYGNREPYALDEPDAAAWGRHDATGDERHRLVMSGIVELPWGITGSTLITLGSGQAYQLVDVSGGWNNLKFRPGAGKPEKYDFIIPNAWAYRQVDVRLSKDFDLPNGHQFGVVLDAFNIFNFENYGYDDWSSGFIPPEGPQANPNFGKGTRLIGPTRSFQVGVRYRF